MGRGCRRMWRVMPCTNSRRILRTESNKDIQEILKTKLATIQEEPDPPPPEKLTPARLLVAKGALKKKICSNYKAMKKGRFISLKPSYFLFMAAGLRLSHEVAAH
ncbi:hypothetical protein M5689_008594 [Euphorbia peplus]|nr:hypothetical protein M5689_008594 [Euphorbia peplus]